MMKSYRRFSLLIAFFVAVFISFTATVNGNVIGLDFGSDSMKVAIVQPGTPLEIGNYIFYYYYL